MVTQSITIQLPEAVIERARRAADLLHRPLEEVLTETLSASLPNLSDAPAELQAELTLMTWLGDQELWNIAQAKMSPEEQNQLEELSHHQQNLSALEQEQLEKLRHVYGQITLKKARAYALLSLRAGKPLLSQPN